MTSSEIKEWLILGLLIIILLGILTPDILAWLKRIWPHQKTTAQSTTDTKRLSIDDTNATSNATKIPGDFKLPPASHAKHDQQTKAKQ